MSDFLIFPGFSKADLYSVDFKYSKWMWKIHDTLKLNLSFTYFNLIYSGETCLQERIVIETTLTTIGRYCGRRIQWSNFVSSPLITLAFHTFNYSRSYFMLQHQLTTDKLSTFMFTNKTLNNPTVDFKNSFVSHKYILANDIYYNWNIFVSKMFKLCIIPIKVNPDDKANLYLYDGPDFHASQFNTSSFEKFTSSSFQVSILFHGHFSDIVIKFESYIFKQAVQNFKTFLVKEKSEWISSKCFVKSSSICAFHFHVPRGFFVNITLLNLNYSGPNIGYCQYGGLSIYDYVNNKIKEILLLCDNWPSIFSIKEPNRSIVSNTKSLFVVLFSYPLHSMITFNLGIEKTSCQGVHLQR